MMYTRTIALAVAAMSANVFATDLVRELTTTCTTYLDDYDVAEYCCDPFLVCIADSSGCFVCLSSLGSLSDKDKCEYEEDASSFDELATDLCSGTYYVALSAFFECGAEVKYGVNTSSPDGYDMFVDASCEDGAMGSFMAFGTVLVMGLATAWAVQA